MKAPIHRTAAGNFMEFDGHRLSLDTATEHALMGALKHGEYRQFRDAKNVLWEVNPDGAGEFTFTPHGGHTVATLKGDTVVALINDLRAIIMGA